MPETTFQDWESQQLAEAAGTVLRQTKGFVTEQEVPVLRALADGAMPVFERRLLRIFANWPPERLEIKELLARAFVAGWSCRGAVEAVLHDEVPQPAEVR